MLATSGKSWFTLRDLSLPVRCVIAAFLMSVGFGYVSALVQLHFNGGTKAGDPLPDGDAVVAVYSGTPPQSQLERLIVADEHKTFNGSGTMRPAFTTKSSRWSNILKKRAKDKNLGPDETEKQLRQERDLEIKAVVSWIHSGAKEDEYAKCKCPDDLAPKVKDYPESKFFPVSEDDRQLMSVKEIINVRCARCHYDGARGAEGQIHLDDFEVVREYATTPADGTGAGMSLQKLAQSTHVHLLGFSMLYGLTGILFALTSYPGWLRALFAPWALVAQLLDISCWWLARIDPVFAQAIRVTGGLVALGLGVQIMGTLFNMFDKKGRLVLLALILAAGAGGGILQLKVIGPYLEQERSKNGHLQAVE
jgi:hypothetical protein